MKTSKTTIFDLQESIQDGQGFTNLEDYITFAEAFLHCILREQTTRIISPSHQHYIFYQLSDDYAHAISRPLNTQLFYESPAELKRAFEKFLGFLDDCKRLGSSVLEKRAYQSFVKNNELCRVLYTLQQAIGCVGDSFANTNQARKRIGQLFETLIAYTIKHLGLECEPRVISLPIPDFPDYRMNYELDVVFSKHKTLITSETPQLLPSEIVGSIKTTSKDRIDKIFLDKFLLSKLLQRDVPVIALFLHDVQRAKRGDSIFGINSTFKTNHFLGYTVAFTQLDGVYYIDPRPEMQSNPRLREQIRSAQEFFTNDIWQLIQR